MGGTHLQATTITKQQWCILNVAPILFPFSRFTDRGAAAAVRTDLGLIRADPTVFSRLSPAWSSYFGGSYGSGLPVGTGGYSLSDERWASN